METTVPLGPKEVFRYANDVRLSHDELRRNVAEYVCQAMAPYRAGLFVKKSYTHVLEDIDFFGKALTWFSSKASKYTICERVEAPVQKTSILTGRPKIVFKPKDEVIAEVSDDDLEGQRLHFWVNDSDLIRVCNEVQALTDGKVRVHSHLPLGSKVL